MKLNVGERLEGAGPAQQPGGYVVTGVIRETPWHGLYAGKKIFYNFDFTAKRVRETDEVEWLDVFIRTNRYPILDDPTYVAQRRALARAEVRAILGNRHSNLWPEPLDLLEVENTRDPFAFATEGDRANEPILVYARAQGRSTQDWQQQILPITSILSVLAELLEFMKQAHAEGLLLLGVGPDAILIDASDRVHYVGTDLVLSQQSGLLRNVTPAALWARLFPTERFTRGYAAPECYDPTRRPDARADLYAWGMLAYSLLAGANLTAIAEEQGRPWLELNHSHWTQLEKLLAQLPPDNLAGWAEQIGVDPRALLEGWPGKLIKALRLVTSPDPARRPRSVADLLAWLVDPPPPAVTGLVALHTGPDFATLLIDCAGIEPGLEMTIQCDRSVAPQLPSEGATLAEGILRSVVGVTALPLTMEPIFFTVFTRTDHAGRRAYSSGVSAEMWQPTAENLRHWVENQAAQTRSPEQPPTLVSMVLAALEPCPVTDALLPSSDVHVRTWALRRVEQGLRGQTQSERFDAILWRYLADPSVELRQAAAALFWSIQPVKTDALLVRLVEAIEAPPIDTPAPVAHFLRQLRLPEERIQAVLHQLETRRPTECPLCKQPLTYGERGAHLQKEHGYLQYQGDLLAAPTVFHRLWERVFEKHDRLAHEDLLAMYASLPEARRDPDAAIAHYVADLQRFLIGEAPIQTIVIESTPSQPNAIPVAFPVASVLAYQSNLRGSRSFLPIARALLHGDQPRLRELGVQAILPFFKEQLRIHGGVADLRRLLGQVTSNLDQADLQIDLCRQLGQLGIDQALVGSCIAELEQERLVTCADCGAAVKAKDLEVHLRRAHEVFQFRGQRHAYVETRQAILQAVCTTPLDLAAWRSLYALAQDKHPEDPQRFLGVWLLQHVKDVDPEQRGGAIAALAEVVIAADAVAGLMFHFAGPNKNASWELLGQHIALELCMRSTAPLPAAQVRMVFPLLDHKDLPRRSRENTMLALLRMAQNDRALSAELLRAFTAQTSKKRGVEKLQFLEQRFGHSPAIDAAIKELDDEIRMSCPRCPTELRKKDMVEHLWQKHRLVLDGQTVREPWRVIEDWVVDYGLEKDHQVLQRCRELAQKVDPQAGLVRLQRLLFRQGLRERDILNELRAQIKGRKATLCPHCCAPVPMPESPEIAPLSLEGGRLAGFGYVLEVSERGVAPSLRIETPDAIVYQGRQPGRGLTRLGTALLLIGPMVIATYLLVDWVTERAHEVGLLWSVAAGVGLTLAGLMYVLWPNPRPAKERLVRAAWTMLVPEIIQEDMGPREWSFLHGLIDFTEQVRRHSLDHELLLEICEQASEAAREDPVALACLAAFSRRYLADLSERGDDPFDFVLTLSSECFKGKLPLAFLEDLFGCFRGRQRGAWAGREVNRLPILIAQEALAADVEIDDWLNLGRAFPVTSVVLGLEQRWHWLQFFALWSQRNQRPWDNVGKAITMIELARDPTEFDEVLTHYPDVLLYVPKANLVIGSKGVWIEGVCVTSFQSGADVSFQKISGQYELTVGSVKIRCSENPRAYLDDIKRWLRFCFEGFLPTVSSLARPQIESRHRMWHLSKLTCPECSKPLVPCLGELALSIR